jgi:hypothetical protein
MNRKDFLKTSVIGTAAIATLPTKLRATTPNELL